MQIYQPIVTGSLTVVTGSSVELRVTDVGVNIGNAVTDTHTVTGSLNVSGSIVGYTQNSQTGSFYRLVSSQALGPADGNFDINTTVLQTVLSKSITGIQTGDAIEAEFWYTILNNTGATKSYTYEATLGPFSQSYNPTQTIAGSTTQEAMFTQKVMFFVSASNFAQMFANVDYTVLQDIGTAQDPGAIGRVGVKVTQTTTNNLTGTQTFIFKARSSATGGNNIQTLKLRGYKLTLIKKN